MNNESQYVANYFSLISPSLVAVKTLLQGAQVLDEVSPAARGNITSLEFIIYVISTKLFKIIQSLFLTLPIPKDFRSVFLTVVTSSILSVAQIGVMFTKPSSSNTFLDKI